MAEFELEGDEVLEQTIDDIQRSIPEPGDPVEWVIGTNVEYAAHVEFGTSPHVITPDSADALQFEVDGEEVFAQVVEHPGTPAQPFMRPAFREAVIQEGEDLADDADDVAEFVASIALTIERKAKRKAPVDTGTLRASIQARRIS